MNLQISHISDIIKHDIQERRREGKHQTAALQKSGEMNSSLILKNGVSRFLWTDMDSGKRSEMIYHAITTRSAVISLEVPRSPVFATKNAGVYRKRRRFNLHCKYPELSDKIYSGFDTTTATFDPPKAKLLDIA